MNPNLQALLVLEVAFLVSSMSTCACVLFTSDKLSKKVAWAFLLSPLWGWFTFPAFMLSPLLLPIGWAWLMLKAINRVTDE